MGAIYILTNPSFPQLVKIGYADDVNRRVTRLNKNPGLPYSYRIYATYDVNERLEDLTLHKIIDTLNPTLRTKEAVNGKTRVREFFAMSAETAYELFLAIAEISGTEDRLHKHSANHEQIADEENAEEIRELPHNRRNFKGVTFTSSLTGKTYDSRNNVDGSLGIKDLGEEGNNDDTLYQLMHKLERVILNKRSEN